MTRLEPRHVRENGIGNFLRGQVLACAQDANQPILPIHLALGVLRVQDTVRHKYDRVARLSNDAEFLIRHIGKQAKREALGANRGGFAGAAKDGLYRAGVGHLKRPAFVVPQGEEHGHILRFEFAFLKRVIQVGQHLGGLMPVQGGGAHDAADQGCKQGRGGRLPADVAQDDGGASGTIVHKIVQVAADGARRQKSNRHFCVDEFGRGRRQQTKLDFAGHRHIALELAFLAPDGLIEPGVFNRYGHLRRQGRENPLVLFVEEPGAGMFQIEHPDDPSFVKKGRDEFRSGFLVHGQIARILAHIRYVHQPPLAYYGAHQAFRHRDAPQGRVRIAEAPGIACDEYFSLLIKQHHRKHLVVDEPTQKLPYTLEKRVKFQDGSELNCDLVQHFEGLRLAGNARVEPGVLNSLGDARGREREQAKVFRAEEAELLALEIHYANETIFGNQGQRQFRSHIRRRGNVVFRTGNVVDQDRLTRKCYLPDDAFADGDARALDLGGVADLEPHAQIAGAVVQQQYGEDAILNDRPHQFRGAFQQGLQVERGVQRVGHLSKIGQVRRLDADIYRARMSCQAAGFRRAIIVLELCMLRRNWGARSHRHRRRS